MGWVGWLCFELKRTYEMKTCARHFQIDTVIQIKPSFLTPPNLKAVIGQKISLVWLAANRQHFFVNHYPRKRIRKSIPNFE
jgi:hypothetical protein